MAGYHDSRFVYDAERDVVWRAIIAYLLRAGVIQSGGDVLDLGAGYAHFINNVPARRRFAMDVVPEMAKHAAAGVVALAQSCHAPWPLEPSSLDAVLASNLLEHLSREELDRTVDEMRRVLRPGGRVVVIQPNYRYAYREYFDDYTHVAVFSHVSLADYFVSRSFKTVRIEPKFLPFSMKSRLPKSRRLIDWYLRSPVRPLARQMLVVMEKP